jgi:hypothetical protein
MTARRILRSHTTRTVGLALLFTSSPLIVLRIAPPRGTVTFNKAGDPDITEHYEKRIENVMANPNLDGSQKDRNSKRFAAVIDLNAGVLKAQRHSKELADASKRVREMDSETKAEYCKSTLLNLAQKQLAINREVSGLSWRASMLCVFAPWEDVTLFERAVKLSALVSVHGLQLPLQRGLLRLMILANTTSS